MKFRTIFHVLLLLFTLTTTNCGIIRTKKNPTSVAEAEKELAKKNKKANRKSNEEAEKRYWSMQSKQSIKSIKKNKKRNKRMARHKKKR
tara:strand:- start:599 stop:865 length:267 start_codon:yes stop_codon:yes gene_type:complete